MPPAARRTCRNAEPGTAHAKRPAPYGGPRTPVCASCNREKKREDGRKARDARIQKTYTLSPEEYDALHAAQGGRCAICQRATGAIRRLAVDHDHKCCNGPVSCGKCVRGLLCKSCNRMLGRMRDDADAFARAAEYLRRPPAPAVLLRL